MSAKRTKKLSFFRKRRFYALTDTLEYREIRFPLIRIALSGIVAGVLFLTIVLVGNHLSGDVLGIGYNELSLLTTENRILKDQLVQVSERMSELQESIDDIAQEGNDLRVVTDLSPLDEDTRTAGAGGSQGIPELAYVGTEANEILRNSSSLLDQLSREVEIQRVSYEAINAKYNENEKYFKHVPSIKPVRGAYSIRGFGMRVHPVLHIRRMHEGIDIITDVGTNIYAAADGVVRYSGRTRGGYGTVVEISHGYGYSTLYAHVSKTLVRPGQTVRRGDLIAKSGRTGLVSGPHLHYEVRHRGRKMNPVDYFFDDVEASTYQAELAAATTN